MKNIVDIRTLTTLYDKGLLVPFVGSGMSRPVCADWAGFVKTLEKLSGDESCVRSDSTLIQRAMQAIETLRRNGHSIPEKVRKAVYLSDEPPPQQTDALTDLYWPLICTTNYDDLLVRAKEKKNENYKPTILGRSESDCRQLLKHMKFPEREVIWALQGYVEKDDSLLRKFGQYYDENITEQLVVGHAQYRAVTHKSNHFRRCFSEVFRNRSFLFLGSGLAEPYFLSLFDEVIELVGPPARPHFALVTRGSVDPEFMKRQYHIICEEYSPGDHGAVIKKLRCLSESVNGSRPRQSSWNYVLNSAQKINREDAGSHFNILRMVLPKPSELGSEHVVAISCGRGSYKTNDNQIIDKPLFNPSIASAMELEKSESCTRLNEYVVKWDSPENVYGVVARESVLNDTCDSDSRSPDSIRKAFYELICKVSEMKTEVKTIHVQLLAAGPKRAFSPWVSLIQMARGFEQWYREKESKNDMRSLTVNLYLVDPSLLFLLSEGYLDVKEQLYNNSIKLTIQQVDSLGGITEYHEFVSPEDKIMNVFPVQNGGRKPRVSAQPRPSKKSEHWSYDNVQNVTVSEFGLVSGSTLIFDFR